MKSNKPNIGDFVLHTFGHHDKPNRAIRKVVKVNKKSFKISHSFSLFNFYGDQKGILRLHWPFISNCEIISEEKGRELVSEWKEKREKKEMIDYIKNELENIETDKIKEIFERIKELNNESSS